MAITLTYHVRGEFVSNSTYLIYEGGELITISEVDPEKITLVDLKVGIKSQLSSKEFQLYFTISGERGVDAFRLIHNAASIRAMLLNYKDMEVYHIFVEEHVQAPTVGVIGRNTCNGETGKESNSENDEDDEDFEVGSWVSEEDREELEEVKNKLTEAKKNLREGLKFAISDDDDDFNDSQSDEDDGGFASDEIGYYEDTDSEDETADHGIRRKMPLTMYDPNTEKPYFELGMGFTDVLQAREAIQKHAIMEKKDVRFKKNEPKRIRLHCTWRGCKWQFFASHNKRYNVLQLKKLKKHRCPDHYKNKYISPKLIAERYKLRIRSNPKWRIGDMREAIKEDFGTDVTKMQCSRAKGIVLHRTMKCYKEEFGLLRPYGEAILRTNPGSTVKIKVNVDNPGNEPLFERIYVCFDALKRGFLAGCRKVIALDGSFLKGLCKGEVLSAVGRDANDQMYPIAWGVVELESKSSWDWFLEQLQQDLNIHQGGGWVIISDQQKGLMPSVNTLFLDAEHRLCARHIYSNWRKKFKSNAWQKLFWKCAKASTEAFFNRAKEKLAVSNPSAAESMVAVHPKHWSRAFFATDVKCDSVDNNMSESFNALILEARHKPIYTLLEEIRIMCMESIAKKRALAHRWKSDICPKILKKLAKNAEKTRFCHILSNGKYGYEVRHKMTRFRVQLAENKCSCRVWELSGISCAHAIPCILSEGHEPEQFISRCFSLQNYWLTYDHVMEPMDGPKLRVATPYAHVLPPAFRAMPGRPKKRRIQSVQEKEDGKKKRKQHRVYSQEELLTRDKHDKSKLGRVGRVMSCKYCGGNGHNIRSCLLRKEKQVADMNGGEASGGLGDQNEGADVNENSG